MFRGILKNNLSYRGTILDISEGGIKFREEDSGLMDGITEGDQRLFGTDIDFYAIKGKGEVKWFLKNKVYMLISINLFIAPILLSNQ